MQINKLLQTVVNQNASDLILTVAAKPMLRLNGRLVPLQTKVLEPEDTVALMRSITSERCQQELQEVGSTDFGFSYGEQARFRVSVFKQRGYTGIVLRLIPNKLLSFERDRPDRGHPAAALAPPRTGPRHRPHRLGQDDHARHDG